MNYILSFVLSLGMLAAQENEIVLPIKSDAGYLKIGLPGAIEYSRYNGPDFCVYSIIPKGLGGGWSLSIYEGDHPNSFPDYKSLKTIKVSSNGSVYDVDLRDTKSDKSIMCLVYFPFGHRMRLNEMGVEMPTKDDRQLQFMIYVPDEKSIQAVFDKIRFELVK